VKDNLEKGRKDNADISSCASKMNNIENAENSLAVGGQREQSVQPE
jgi:hypothetical protein